MGSAWGWIRGCCSAAGTGVAYLLGGWDVALYALLVLNIIDILGGVLQAVSEKKLNSRVCLKGVLSKAYLYLMIGALVAVERMALPGLPPVIHTAATIWFCLGEALSVLEHGAYFGLALPGFLVEALEKVRKGYEDGGLMGSEGGTHVTIHEGARRSTKTREHKKPS